MGAPPFPPGPPPEQGVAPPLAPHGGREPHPPTLPEVARWAAIQTRPRAEKVVASHLSRHRVPHYLPVTLSRRVYGTRIRRSWLPLFPGYLFYDHGRTDRRVVYASRKVARIMVPEDFTRLRDDLENLAVLLDKTPDLSHVRELSPGTPVEITAGPYQGTRGELIRRRGRTQLVIRVHFINYGAVLDIDESCVRRLDSEVR